MATATTRSGDNEVTILARFLTNGDLPLPKNLARYILGLTIGERDRLESRPVVGTSTTHLRRLRRKRCTTSARPVTSWPF